MSMSKENSTQLWNAVQDSPSLPSHLTPHYLLTLRKDDFAAFHKINSILLNPAAPLKHIPLRIYIPSLSSSPNDTAALGSVRTWQSLIPPTTSNREVQTLGSALRSILPELFPSKRDPLYAEPILHGAPVPLRAPLEEVMREAAYADGWVHLGLRMM
jgi:autophagy-related protein 5